MMVGDGEDAEFVVCIPVTNPMKFWDNQVSTCRKCGCLIQHRPHVPKTPPKICWDCALPGMNEARESDDLAVVVSDKTMADIRGWFTRKMRH
jgi:hypothetical protein